MKNGVTPMLLASRMGHTEVADLLWDEGGTELRFNYLLSYVVKEGMTRSDLLDAMGSPVSVELLGDGGDDRGLASGPASGASSRASAAGGARRAETEVWHFADGSIAFSFVDEVLTRVESLDELGGAMTTQQ
jgi:ankyrin repeat protein